MSDSATVANVGGDTVIFVEGGAPVRIDAGTDALVESQSGFLGSTLRVEIIANAAAGEDVLAIAAAPGIQLRDGSIFVDDIAVGTVTGGTGVAGEALSILFNAAADSASVSRILQALTYANSNQAAPSAATRTVSIALTDSLGAVASAESYVQVFPVNDAPVLTYSGTTPATIYSESVTGTSTVSFGATLADVDSASFSSAVVRISENYRPGEDSLRFVSASPSQHVAFYGDIQSVDNGDGSVSLSSAGAATRLQWQNALRSVQYSNSSQEPDQSVRTIAFQIDDGHDRSNVLTRTLQVVANNDAPVGADTNTTVLEDSRTILSRSHFGFSDPDGDSFTGLFIDSVTLGTVWYDSDGAGPGAPVALTSFPAWFTADDLAEGRLSFTPLADLSGYGSARIGFRVRDDGGTAGIGRDTDQSANSAWFHINWVADIVADSVELVRNSGANRLDLLANDTFENPGRAITAVGTAGHGTVTINNAGTSADPSDDYVVYTPAANYYGADSFTYTVTSAGSTEMATVSINVIAAEAPVLTNPAGFSLAEDSSLMFGSASGNAFQVSDVNSASLTVTLSAARGQLTLSGIAGLSFSAGDGAGDTAMTFSGSVGAINAALQGLQYAPFADYYGADLIAFSATDGVYSDSATVKAEILSDGLIDVLPPGWVMSDALNDADGAFRAEIAPLTSGGYVLLYWDSRFSEPGKGGYPLRAQIYSAEGEKVGGAIEVPTELDGNFRSYSVAGLESGGFVVLVSDYRDLTPTERSSEIFARLFDSTGAAVGDLIPVNSTFAGQQYSPTAVGLSSGGFVVAWYHSEYAPPSAPVNHVKAQIFDEAGQRQGDEIVIPPVGTLFRNNPEIAALTDGGFILTWMDDTGAGTSPQGDYQIFAQRFDADGEKVRGEFQVNTTSEGTQGSQSVTGLATGGFVVTWTDSGRVGVSPEQSAIRGQIYDSSGARIGGELLIAGPTPGYSGNDKVTALDNGGFFVAWTDRSGFGGDSSGSAVKGQFFDASGAKLGGEFLVNERTEDNQMDPFVAGLSWGGIAVGYGDFDIVGTTINMTVVSRILSEGIPGTANPDSISTFENAPIVNAMLLGNDIAPVGSELAVATVNGSESNVGSQILLASGARLTVRSNGTFDYDPSGRFNHLIAAGGTSGAVNSSATETFSYGMVGGGTATVTITIQGVASAGDRLEGNSGDNAITGTGGNDNFRLQDGGTDSAIGGDGNDFFLFGGSLDMLDSVDGGSGADQVAIQGNYSLTLGAGFVNIESLIPLPGSDTRFGDSGSNFYSYNLTAVDANLSAGQRLTVDANRLRAGEDFTFNGTAETDGNFFLVGGHGVDTFTGGLQNDTFLFGENGQFGASDTVDGGPSGNNDQLALRGNYTVTFGAGQMTGIEAIVLVSAQDTRFGPLGSVYNYNLTMHDSNAVGGVLFTIDGGNLRGGETLTVDAGAETDASYRIAGGAGADTITGGQQGDLLIGRIGADTLRGGAGNDVFRIDSTTESNAAGRDSILDFANGDRIDLSRMDADSGAAGNQAFAFIGNAAFGKQAGELRFEHLSGNAWLIQGDTDGNGLADFEVSVTIDDLHPLTGSDFIL